MRLTIQGTGASRGLTLGRARVREPHMLDVVVETLDAGLLQAELERLHQALAVARAELSQMRGQLKDLIAHGAGEYLDVHAVLLDDPELLQGLEDLILKGHYSAPSALKLQRDRVAAVFASMDDPYLKSRHEDIDHVIGRVYAALHRQRGAPLPPQSGEVLVAETIAPTELAQLRERGVVALVTAAGSPLSHCAILARSLHLPLVVGAHHAIEQINDGDVLVVDGDSGTVIVEPDERDLGRFRRQQALQARERRGLTRLRHAATRTLDGVDIGLYANAESPADVAEAHALGAAGVGLYRTEFLFLQGTRPPDEEEQFNTYRELVTAMAPHPVTIRTLDLGADKADGFGLSLGHEDNPALGLRGIRFALAHTDLFRAQLRAILRASALGPVQILLPMVSGREELQHTRALLAECQRELAAAGVDFDPQVQVGAMIEVPAAALMVESLVGMLDFMAIGTNDLVQYLLAADRGNDAVGELHSPLHPAVLRLIHQVIDCGHRHRVPVSVCGEMAGEPSFTRLLLALGLTRFSLHPSNLLEVRRMVRDSDRGRLRRRARSLLAARDRDAIAMWLDRS